MRPFLLAVLVAVILGGCIAILVGPPIPAMLQHPPPDGRPWSLSSRPRTTAAMPILLRTATVTAIGGKLNALVRTMWRRGGEGSRKAAVPSASSP